MSRLTRIALVLLAFMLIAISGFTPVTLFILAIPPIVLLLWKGLQKLPKERRFPIIGGILFLLVFVVLPLAAGAVQIGEDMQSQYTVHTRTELKLAGYTVSYVLPGAYGTIVQQMGDYTVVTGLVVSSRPYQFTARSGFKFDLPDLKYDLGFIRSAQAVAKTWDGGGGGDTNWNTATNWDADALPVANDNVIFNVTSNTAVTVNIATPVLTGFDMQAAYTNTITVTIAQTDTWGPVTMAGASTLATGAFAVTISSFNASAAGAIVTSTGAGSWTVTSSWTNSSTSASWAFSSPITFNSAANQTMTFCSTCGTTEFAGAMTFSSTAAGVQTFTMATNGLRATGALNINDGVSTTTLTTSGANLAITSGALTIGAGGILTANGSTITITGNFTFSAGTFTIGTSTVVMAATSNIVPTLCNAGTAGNFYNLTINAGITVTRTLNAVCASNVMTVNGAIASGNWVVNNGTAGDGLVTAPLVLGGGASLTGVTEFFFSGQPVAGQIPSATYPILTIQDTGGLYTFQGAITTNSNFNVLTEFNSTATVNTGNFTLTDGGLMLVGRDVAGSARFQAGTSTITVVGSITTLRAGDFITSTAGGSWTASGLWSNSSTSASWSFTAPITFTSTTSRTMTFCACGGGTEFLGNVTFDPNDVTANPTFTEAGNALTVNSGQFSATTLTIRNSAGDATHVTTFTDATNNLGWTIGALTVGSRGTMTLGSGTYTVTNAWNTNSATALFNKGTSTVTMGTFSGRTVATLNSTNGFYNLTVSGGVTMSTAIDVSNATSISGTLATASLALSGAGTMTITATGTLTANASTVTVSSVTMTGAGGTITVTTGTWNVSNNWNTSGAGSTLTTGATSNVNFTGVAMTINLLAGQSFGNISFLSGSRTLSSAITVQSDLSTSAGFVTFTTAGFAVTMATLTHFDGGIVASTSTVIVTGAAFIDVTAYITSTAGGSWRYDAGYTNDSASASWSFAAPVTFTAAGANATIRPCNGCNAGGDEFSSGTVTFNTTAIVNRTFTLALRDLRANTITITDNGATTSTLIAGAFNLVFNALTVDAANGGRLTMDGLTITNQFTLTQTVAASRVTMNTLTSYSFVLGAENVNWNYTVSDAASALTWSVSGFQPLQSYAVTHGGANIGPLIANAGGVISYTVTGAGADIILPLTSAGGGGGFSRSFDADFLVGVACSVVSFQVVSHDPKGTQVATALWNFGDGQSSTELNPTHRYIFSGRYVVSATLNGPFGEQATPVKNLNVINCGNVMGSMFIITMMVFLALLSLAFLAVKNIKGMVVTWLFGGVMFLFRLPLESFLSMFLQWVNVLPVYVLGLAALVAFGGTVGTARKGSRWAAFLSYIAMALTASFMVIYFRIPPWVLP